MASHDNSGACPHCIEILNTYPGIDEDLAEWFRETQKTFNNFHIAEAGRGKIAQEKDFARGASRAHYGHSAHNYNAAIDTFFLVNGAYSLDERLFDAVVVDLPFFIEWYGAKGAVFYERPHFEKIAWKYLADQGLLVLVE